MAYPMEPGLQGRFVYAPTRSLTIAAGTITEGAIIVGAMAKGAVTKGTIFVSAAPEDT